MIEVILDETDSVERALRAFRRKVHRTGLLKALRDKRHYLKPSVAKKVKAEADRRRERRGPG